MGLEQAAERVRRREGWAASGAYLTRSAAFSTDAAERLRRVLAAAQAENTAGASLCAQALLDSVAGELCSKRPAVPLVNPRLVRRRRRGRREAGHGGRERSAAARDEYPGHRSLSRPAETGWGSPVPGSAPSGPLLADFSLDITSKELGELEPPGAVIPAGTPVQQHADGSYGRRRLLCSAPKGSLVWLGGDLEIPAGWRLLTVGQGEGGAAVWLAGKGRALRAVMAGPLGQWSGSRR